MSLKPSVRQILFGKRSPWTPANIATALWLDAADNSTITLSSGNVTQWNDKSGNNRHATQASSGNQPTVSTALINGLDTIRLTSAKYLSNATTQLALPIRSSFIVFRERTAIANSGILTLHPATANDWNRSDAVNYSKSDTTTTAFQFNCNNDYILHDTLNPSLPIPLRIYTEEKTVGLGRLLRNGLEITTETSFTEPSSLSGGGYSIGARFFNGAISTLFSIDIDLCEVVYLENVNSVTNRKMEGYLAHKWGLTANLASDHPYKTTPPTV